MLVVMYQAVIGLRVEYYQSHQWLYTFHTEVTDFGIGPLEKWTL